MEQIWASVREEAEDGGRKREKELRGDRKRWDDKETGREGEMVWADLTVLPW